jgi:hypothetical protein
MSRIQISPAITRDRLGEADPYRLPDGTLLAFVYLGACVLEFDDAQLARDVAFACVKAADALDAMAAGTSPS